MRIGLLNLMPDKISTETQLARLLGATPLQIELTLVRISDHVARNTPAGHIAAFYQPWSDVSAKRFDGFIITGAPIERLPFEEVSYWPELRSILDWTQTHVHGCLTLCWAAQAALHHFHGVPKRELPRKAFGVFPHRNLAPTSPYLRGFSDAFDVPVSRWTEVCRADLPTDRGLHVLAESDEAGLCLVEDPLRRSIHMFNHLEYDTATLAAEYRRDGGAQLPVALFPRRRSFAAADEQLAQPRPSAVRQLDQRNLPEHALRPCRDRQRLEEPIGGVGPFRLLARRV